MNNTVNQLDLVDICTTLHPTKANYTFFSTNYMRIPQMTTLCKQRFHRKNIIRNKDHCIMKKKLSHHFIKRDQLIPENTAIIYIQLKVIVRSTIIFKSLNTPPAPSNFDRGNRWKISKNIIDLSSIIKEFDVIVIFRKLHPTTAKYKSFQQHK